MQSEMQTPALTPSPLYSGEKVGVRGGFAKCAIYRTAPYPSPPPYGGEGAGTGSTASALHATLTLDSSPRTLHPARMSTHPALTLTRAQVREIDRRCIEEFHIPGVVLMENASRGVADAVAEELLALTGRTTGRVLILCGGGNNGGDGLAVARHLHNRHCHVQIGLTIDPATYRGDALIQWQIVQAMRQSTFAATSPSIRRATADLLIDAIFGTGLTAPPRDPFAEIVDAIESTKIPILAIDLPSGLDCDTGEPLGRAIRACRTVTFVAEKAGFKNPASHEYTGRVTVADIRGSAGIGRTECLIGSVQPAVFSHFRPPLTNLKFAPIIR